MTWKMYGARQLTVALVFGLLTLQEVWACGVGDASPVRAYYCFVHWVSVGRADLAALQFADDAIVVVGPKCTASVPCIGRAAIRERYILKLNAGYARLPVGDPRFEGRSLRTRGETVFASEPGQDAVRLRGGHVFEFRDGRIASLRVELDADDPATAAYLQRCELEIAMAHR